MVKQYRHDMSNEGSDNVVFPEGWREFIITDCKSTTFKSGNPGFEFKFMDIGTGQDFPIVRAIDVPGKRWFLKQILIACEIPAGEDGIYEWDITDVLNKQITGKIENCTEEWTDRNGIKKAIEKSKMTAIRKSGKPIVAEYKKNVGDVPF